MKSYFAERAAFNLAVARSSSSIASGWVMVESSPRSALRASSRSFSASETSRSTARRASSASTVTESVPTWTNPPPT